MPKPKLPPGEAKRRERERSKRSNAISKAKRDAERAAGIPAVKRILTEAEKEAMRIRVREYRAKQRLLKPPRIPMTPEQRRLRAIEKTRKSYEKKLAMQGKVRQVPVKKRTKEIKTKPMEKILKARPANRISEKVIKPVKIDATRQTVCKILTDDTGKVRVKLNEKTWVYASPGYDVDALRRKFKVC